MKLSTIRQIFALLACLAIAGCGGGGGSIVGAATPTGSDTTTPAGSGGTGGTQLAAASQLVDGTTVGTAPAAGSAGSWVDGDTASGGAGQPVAGLDCTLDGGSYSRAHLSILLDGQPLQVPANIGRADPPVQQYGCYYPVQTNDRSGRIRFRDGSAPPSLGQFFAVWGEPLSSTNVAGITGRSINFYVNDGGTLTPFSGDPNTIPLTAGREITIVIGNPPAQIPTFAWADPPPLASTLTSIAGTVGTQTVWADGDTGQGGQGQPLDGLTCGNMTQDYHVHPHVSIIRDGTMLVVPQYIGITATCDYNVHVHDQSGVIHVETPTYDRRFTLGQLFDLWGEPLSSTNVAGLTGEPVAVYIEDGGNVRQWMGDIRDIDLFSRRSIVIQVGSRIASVPAWDWAGAGYTH